MIRLTWLQWRIQAAVAAAGLVIVAVGLVITGPHLVDLYNTNVAPCAARGKCTVAIAAFLKNDSTLNTWLGVFVVVVPGTIGIFWGAPLVALELETSTYRLAWTQSVTRPRWLTVKLGVIGLASMAVAGLLSLMVTWWASPIDRANMNIYKSFDQHDIVPVGYAAVAFVLGATAGAPGALGCGSTASGPSTLMPLAPSIPNAWIYSTRLVDQAGHALTSQYVDTACPTLAAGQGGGPPPGAGNFHTGVPASAQAALQDCVTKIGATYHEAVTYQPGNCYWTFQWHELVIYLSVAVALGAVCFWWVVAVAPDRRVDRPSTKDD